MDIDTEHGMAQRGEAVLYVNAEMLADERQVGINAVRADHQDRGRFYTVPLYAAPQPPSAPVEVDGLRGAVARGWCAPENAHKVMDPELAEAIVREVAALAQQPATCDMGELCIGCEPRNADGSCPNKQPAAVDELLLRANAAYESDDPHAALDDLVEYIRQHSSAALPPSAPVGVECPQCGSESLSWEPIYTNKSGVPDGRLRVHDVGCVFALGCNECSETVRVVGADAAAIALAQQPAAPEGMDEAIRRLETTAFNIERIRVMDDNARRFAVEDIRAAVAMLAAAQQEPTT